MTAIFLGEVNNLSYDELLNKTQMLSVNEGKLQIIHPRIIFEFINIGSDGNKTFEYKYIMPITNKVEYNKLYLEAERIYNFVKLFFILKKYTTINVYLSERDLLFKKSITKLKI